MPVKSPAYTRSVKLTNTTIIQPVDIQAASIMQPVDIQDTTIMQPVDIQARRKDSRTLFSGTVTANGNTADIDLSDFSEMEVEIKVTSVGGTSPTLNVYVEGKFETTGDYKPITSQPGITTTGTWFPDPVRLRFRLVRVRWIVGGTSPSFTFTVAVQLMV